MTPEKAETLKKLRASVGQLSTTTLRQLEKSLPWYSRLSSDERSALGMVAQNGIAAFVTWYERPSSPSWILSDVFGTAPTELTRSISLQKALQLIRIVVEVVEDQVPVIAPEADQPSLREAVLRYSREVAFAAADVYARAAESRGSWDTRLEALIVDAILRGENTDALRSRIAALGWKAQERFTVMVGNSPSEPSASYVSELRRTAGRYAEDALVGIQGDRLILILGGVQDRETAYLKLSELFAPGPVVYGAEAGSLLEASGSAQSAFAGLTAARAWPSAPRPVAADDLLPGAGHLRRRRRPPFPGQEHLPAAAGRVQRAGGDPRHLPGTGPFARGDRPGTLRPCQHRALPAQARLRRHRLGSAAAAGGVRAPDRAGGGPAFGPAEGPPPSVSRPGTAT